MKQVYVVFLLLAIAYTTITILLYLYQSTLVYYPSSQDFNNCAGFQEYQKINHKGTRFYFLEQNEEVTVHFHGNAGSTCDRSYLKNILEPSGNSIIFVEYAGYSNDIKKANKETILQDVSNIQEWVEQKKFTSTTLIGQSIGAAVASYYASTADVDKLLLLTPFANIVDIPPMIYKLFPLRLILKENYNNLEYLQNYHRPLLIIHGDSDKIIPMIHSKILYDSVPSTNKRYTKIIGAGHNDMFSFPETEKAMMSFINEK